MIAAGTVTSAMMTMTKAVCRNVSVIMKRLAPSTPAIVASVGIKTSTTMLSASDHDRASQITSQPSSTSGSEQPSAQPTISRKSRHPIGAPCPQVAAAPHGLQPVVLAELRAQPLDVHGDRRQIAEVPTPDPGEQLL